VQGGRGARESRALAALGWHPRLRKRDRDPGLLIP